LVWSHVHDKGCRARFSLCRLFLTFRSTGRPKAALWVPSAAARLRPPVIPQTLGGLFFASKTGLMLDSARDVDAYPIVAVDLRNVDRLIELLRLATEHAVSTNPDGSAR
jgi:hypothetical protein